MSGLRETLAALAERKVIRIEEPGWPGPLYVREMTGRERDAFEAWLIKADGSINRDDYRARFALATLCDEGGARLSADDLELVANAASSVLDVVVERARKLNWLGEAGLEAAKGN